MTRVAGAASAIDPASPRSARRRALAAASLALLSGALLLSFWVAPKNFAIANLKDNPRLEQVLAPIEGDESRTMVARFFASESNRVMFSMVGPAQVVLTAAALLLAWGVTRRRIERTMLSLAFMLSLALAPLVPFITSRGRAIDFVSRAYGNPPEVTSFLIWHGVYEGADLLLLLVALALVFLLTTPERDATAPDLPTS